MADLKHHQDLLFLLLFCFNQLPFVIFLSYPIWYMGSNSAHLLGSLNVEHLVIKEYVWPNLQQQGPFRGPGKEQSLINLQAPASECLKHTDPRAGCASGRHQEGADRAVQSLIFGVEFLLELP